MGVEHEDLVEALEGRLGSRQSARDAVGAFAGAILAEVASRRAGGVARLRGVRFGRLRRRRTGS